MRWQSVARVVVALIGIGCAVAVYVLLRPRPEMAPPPTPAMLDASAKAASKATKQKRVDDVGREVYSMAAGETLAMADGRKLLKKGVTFKFVKGEVRYTVTATEAEASGKSGPTGEDPSKIVFRRNVKMVGDDGFSVETEDATYLSDEQRVEFPGAVTFTRDRLEGRGVGAELFMDRSVLWLYDQSSMTVRPEGSGVPVVISGKRVGLAQNDGYVRAEENARLTREAQRLAADAMMVHFAQGTQSVRRIELVGKSNVQRTGTGQRPDMRGDNIDLDFVPESGVLTHARMDGAAMLTLRDDAGVTRVTGNVIDFYVGADGETLTRLDSTGPTELVLPRTAESPARTIHSNGLVAEGTDPKGLDRAVFSGAVQYREFLPAAGGQAATVRLASSDRLDLSLDGALDQVSTAYFRQNFCFVGPVAPAAPPLDAKCSTSKALPARGTVDDSIAASADEGKYDAKAETLQLRSMAPKRPWLVNREIVVNAQEIDADIERDGIVARGRVESLRRPTATQAKEKPTGLFENGKPMTANANALRYSRVTGIAVYSGNVFMFQDGSKGQDGSLLQAEEVTLDDQKQNLEASGKVRSTFFIERTPDERDSKSPTSTQLNSDRMAYTEAVRKAVYTGNARMESGEPGNRQSLDANQITLEMEPDRRALKWLEGVTPAPGIVIARLPEGRQTTGQRLTYDAATGAYVVYGAPAQFVSKSATTAGTCDVGTGTELTFLRGQGVSNVKNAGVAEGRTVPKPCAEVIK